MRRMMLVVLLLCFTQSYAKDAEIPEALWNAKTAYVQNSGATAKDYTRLCEALKKWGRLELVQDQRSADVFIVLSSSVDTRCMERPGGGGMMSNVQVIINRIRIINVQDGAVLWSDESSSYDKDPKILVSNLKNKMKKKK